ncbi:MAG: hypothetical protein KF816_11580 [Melioribacteraceae bacterium]|nr:hypothetical protein [Melioribacteraceae bacterium]
MSACLNCGTEVITEGARRNYCSPKCYNEAAIARRLQKKRKKSEKSKLKSIKTKSGLDVINNILGQTIVHGI